MAVWPRFYDDSGSMASKPFMSMHLKDLMIQTQDSIHDEAEL